MTCPKCNDTGWYAYDHNHSKVCEACCPHDKGWWELQEHYGKNNGKLCCRRGCGATRDKPCTSDLNTQATANTSWT